jgi:hypothetical protein
VKYCDDIRMDGKFVREWPEVIRVQRGLLDDPPPDKPVKVRFGRRGILWFEADNGRARYQRLGEDGDGWKYQLTTEHEHFSPA